MALELLQKNDDIQFDTMKGVLGMVKELSERMTDMALLIGFNHFVQTDPRDAFVNRGQRNVEQ